MDETSFDRTTMDVLMNVLSTHVPLSWSPGEGFLNPKHFKVDSSS